MQHLWGRQVGGYETVSVLCIESFTGNRSWAFALLTRQSCRFRLRDGILQNPTDGSTPSCAEVDAAGRGGQIEAGICPLIPSMAASVCGCAAAGGGADTSAPSPTPITGDFPQCAICGEGKTVTIL
jgi:hypothetical protein